MALSVVLLVAALGMVQAAPASGAPVPAASAAPSEPAASAAPSEPAASAAPPAGNTIRIDPPTQTVQKDGTFIARVVQHTDVATSGAVATITFDPTLVQVQSVTRAAPYAESAIFSGASPQAITAANTTGSLVGVAAAFFPPDAIPAGEVVFLEVTFRAIGCGAVELGLPTGLTDAGLLDGSPATYGETLSVSTVGGTVALCNTIRIDPPTQTVQKDGTFIARVVQHTDVATSGAVATITFDPTLVQVQSVTRAAPYAESAIFSGASPQAITAANTTGSLVGVAAAFFPPDAIPAGEVVFLEVTFRAIGCGAVELGLPTGLTDAGLLDGSPATYGETLSVSTVGGTVTTCVTASPTPSGSVSPSASASASASASPSPWPTPVPGNSLRIEPVSTSVARDARFSVRVVQHSDLPTGGATASVVFDPTILQIVSVTPSSAYAGTKVRQGASPGMPEAIAAANASGDLGQISATFETQETVNAGDADFVTIEFKAIACGATPLFMPNNAADSALLDGRPATYGTALPIRTIKGVVQVCEPQATPPPPLPPGSSIRLESFYTGVVENGGFTVRVVQRADVPTGGITATIVFDPTILQVVSITKSQAFVAAPIVAGANAAAISAANTSGKLNQVSAAFIAPGNVPAGEADFVSIEFKAIACGETPLFVPNNTATSALVDGRPASYGIPLAIQTVKGIVQACDPEARPTPRPTPTPTPTPTPAPIQAPIQAPVDPPPPTPPSTGGDAPPPPPEPPTPEPTPEPIVEPTPEASPPPVAVVVTPTRPPSARPASLAMSNVAFVGLGVVGLFGGLLIVLMLGAALLAGMLTPLLIVRARAGRRT